MEIYDFQFFHRGSMEAHGDPRFALYCKVLHDPWPDSAMLARCVLLIVRFPQSPENLFSIGFYKGLQLNVFSLINCKVRSVAGPKSTSDLLRFARCPMVPILAQQCVLVALS